MKRILITCFFTTLLFSIINGQRTIDQDPGSITLKNGTTSDLYIRSSGISTGQFAVPFPAALRIGDLNNVGVYISEDDFLGTVPHLNLSYIIEPQQSNYFMRFKNNATDGGDAWDIGIHNGDFGNDLLFRYNGGPTTATLTAGGFWQNSSDRRLKDNIRTINGALESLMQVRPTKYNRKVSPGQEEYGFIAQEIEKIYPEIASKIQLEDGKDTYVMSYTQLIPILTRAIQEQQTIIETQEKKIHTVEGQLEELILKFKEFKNSKK